MFSSPPNVGAIGEPVGVIFFRPKELMLKVLSASDMILAVALTLTLNFKGANVLAVLVQPPFKLLPKPLNNGEAYALINLLTSSGPPLNKSEMPSSCAFALNVTVNKITIKVIRE